MTPDMRQSAKKRKRHLQSLNLQALETGADFDQSASYALSSIYR